MKRHPYPSLYIKKYSKLPPGFDINQYPFPHLIIEALEKSRTRKLNQPSTCKIKR